MVLMVTRPAQPRQFACCLPNGSITNKWLFSLQETYEAKRHEFYGERQRKEEEMKQVFVQRVKEKEAVLKEAEREASALV